MNQWIDFAAIAKILVGGLICGAGLPALFAVGLRALHMGAPAPVAVSPGALAATSTDAQSDRLVGGSRLGIAIATLCFATVLAAIGWGIYLIVAGT
jgi:hypothetical protein